MLQALNANHWLPETQTPAEMTRQSRLRRPQMTQQRRERNGKNGMTVTSPICLTMPEAARRTGY